MSREEPLAESIIRALDQAGFVICRRGPYGLYAIGPNNAESDKARLVIARRIEGALGSRATDEWCNEQ